MSDDSLLPATDESVRCSTFSRRMAVDPGGTAIDVDELIVVDVPLPWPKPVWHKSGFEEVPRWLAAAASSGRRSRPLAAVPEGLPGSPAVLTVHRRRKGSPRLEATRHEAEPEAVPELLRRLLVEGPGSSPGTIVSTSGLDRPTRELLVCTQGSHDVCCGTHGAAFAVAVAEADPALSIRRVSHTGGHRFAPTAMTLPDGRMWGLISVDTMLGVLHHSISPAAAAPSCRGWSGVPRGPAQMAERAVMAEIDDWSFDSAPRTVEITAQLGESTVCEVSALDHLWRVEVVAGRELPVITCGAPGGLPTKPGREWLTGSLRPIN